MKWPEPEGKAKIPEGHYSFRLNKEPELRKFTYHDKAGAEREGHKIIVYAVGIGDNGEYPIADAIAAFEDRYRDLCLALGVEHGRDIQVAGAYFDADVKHELDRKDPTKSYPRLYNIRKRGDVPDIGPEPPGDDVPF